jgi:hypothetical protein
LGKGIPKHTFWEKVYQNIPFNKPFSKRLGQPDSHSQYNYTVYL